MQSQQTIKVWKSDFKDFPFLYEATEWCIGRCVQKAKNFVVIRGQNPYELRNEKRFTEAAITYRSCVEMSEELGYEDKVIEMLHSFEYSMTQIYYTLCNKLNYPEGHIGREWL